MSLPGDLVTALSPVVSTFEILGIPYCIGGSVASSFHGAARSTMDVDVLCELTGEQVSEFLSKFGDDFYISESAVREAIERKSCFNLIHLPTSFKVDVFISRSRPFDRNRMSRATRESLVTENPLTVLMTSAEDSIISKLEWYRRGNETSERQWEDVSRLIRLLGDSADMEYLQRAAESVGVEDLLRRLLTGSTRM